MQRTPNYSVPAHNKSLDPDFVQEFKKNYKKNRADAKKLVSGFLTTYNKKSALEVTKKELKEEYDRKKERSQSNRLLQ